ncbi:calcium-binding protein CML42 [Benincasa hispida]|uniref:calcium-binding protein CML42 n=1 Tax=Benincasa hispida TaxID=102211 RepID=UPI001901FEDB|nr:calcium-binding protein CML42 [Benincasa hispida]
MEAVPSDVPRPRLTKKPSSSSSSFRLRCPSLNSLRLRRIFDMFDKNGDGMITTKELEQALGLLGLDVDESDLDLTVKSFVQPGNAGLRFEDFAALHQFLNDTYLEGMVEDEDEEEKRETSMSSMSQEESDLTEAFRVFDEDGDGYISATELQVVLRKLRLAEGNEIDRVQKMILSVDRNQDGLVDFFEFKDMMRSVIVRSC